jgi:sugar lactone lactonase YvrE
VIRLRRRAAGVALLLVALVPPAALRALERPAWSADGSTVVGLDRGGRRLVAVDAASGATRWSVELTRRVARRLDALAPAPDGAAALVVARGDLWRAGAGQPELRRLTETGDARGAALSPDGGHAGFLRRGALWAVDSDGRETRLTPGPLADRAALGAAARATTPFGWAWSPDGRSVAYLTGAPESSAAVAVVDLLAPGEVRRLDLRQIAGHEIASIRWRPDGKAIAVVSRAPRGERDALTLCHPDKLHCRALAERPVLRPSSGPDELVFLDDGFLWSRADEAGDARLAVHDTVGRERGRLAHPGWALVSLAAVYPDAERLVVTARRADTPATPAVWLVLDLNGRQPPRELGSAAGEELALAPIAPRLVRTTLRRGKAARQTVETIEGGVLAELPR